MSEALRAAVGSARWRSGTWFRSASNPPISRLSARNCAFVISPRFSTWSPYWTPWLSSGRPANPVDGSGP